MRLLSAIAEQQVLDKLVLVLRCVKWLCSKLLMAFELTEHKRNACLHAGIVQEANLSMVHLGSNKASEQHTLWQVGSLHKPLYAAVQYLSCKNLRLTGSMETLFIHAFIQSDAGLLLGLG